MHWIVGDVQGCARELEDLLATVRFDRGRDTLVTVGDLVNRGPDSLAAVRIWEDVGGLGVLGNHEVYAVMAFEGRWPRKADTLDGLFRAPDAGRIVGRLRDLPVLLRLDVPGGAVERVWVVHGGIHPAWHDLEAVRRRLDPSVHDAAFLTSPEVKFATRVRCCTPDGTMCREDGPPERCRPPCRPWDAYYNGADLVVHGHWAWRGHYRGRATIGLDDGCVYGGTLVAYCPEEDRIVRVPSRRRG